MAPPGKPETPPPARRLYRLDTLARCRRELAKLYAEARRGTLEPQAATRLASIVSLIARLIEGGEIERRLEQLESTMGPER